MFKLIVNLVRQVISIHTLDTIIVKQIAFNSGRNSGLRSGWTKIESWVMIGNILKTHSDAKLAFQML